MTTRVIWTDRASADLDGIAAYVDQFDPAAANRLVVRLHDAAASLALFPRRGRIVRHGLRQIVDVYPYVIRYRLKSDTVEIARIYHGARNVRSPRLPYRAEPSAAIA